MDYLILETYAVNYGVNAIVLSLLICFLRLCLKKVFKGRMSSVTRSYIEMAFAVLSEFLFTLIFFKDLNMFTFKSVSSALLSYSLSLIIYSLASRVFKGKPLKISRETLIIEGILSGYVAEEKLSSVSMAIAEAIDSDIDEEELLSLLAEKLSSPVDEEEIIALRDLIVSSVKNVK